MENLKAGDCVGLKSGGPSMVVQNIAQYSGRNRALCVWFDGSKLKEAIFDLPTLKIIDKEADV